MAQLVLLVVAAAWAAVLIPPMLRSRVENHPNSSVTDFRRQLNTLQSTSTPPRGSLRGMGRPLAQSPLHRPAAAGRPGQSMHRQASVQPGIRASQHAGDRDSVRQQLAPSAHASNQQFRSHGDPSGGASTGPHRQTQHGPPERPAQRREAAPVERVVRARRRHRLQHVPRRHHPFDRAALRVRPGVPRRCAATCTCSLSSVSVSRSARACPAHPVPPAPQYQPQYTGQVHGQPYGRSDHR